MEDGGCRFHPVRLARADHRLREHKTIVKLRLTQRVLPALRK
jgi:hypothetical protein